MVALSTLFHRPHLARDMAQKILHVAVGSAAGSGLFLAAPRRTGKSTFMREDLRPALEQAGALVLYVDLWANPSADPGLVIVGAIRAELARHEGVVQRLAKAAGLDKVTVGGLAFDLDRIGLGNEVSLAGALAALSDETARMIVLIIDEAQHAITTAAGVDALFALKAARDELNSSLHHGLRVVCTGSNRDKLAMLRNAKDQAFFGAPLVSFPTLQKDYIDWFCQHADLAFPLDPDQVMELFRQAAYRPEVIGAAADVFRFEFGVDPLDGPQRFAEEVARQAEAINQDMLRVVRSLTPIQSAVLRVMAVTGQAFAPFETATLERYRKALKQAGVKAADAKADVPGVQAALTALQDKKLVWKAARGVYAVEEHSLLVLLERDGLLEGL